MKTPVNIFWFRRDLRIEDNAGLFHALNSEYPVLPVFIFDWHILDQLEDKRDRRVAFIHSALERLQGQLLKAGSSLHVFYGYPEEVFIALQDQFQVKNIFANHDYEAYAIARDHLVNQLLTTHGGQMFTFKDHVIFEKDEVTKPGGQPYTVFTPYSKAWLKKFNLTGTTSFASTEYLHRLLQTSPVPLPALADIGFLPVDDDIPSLEWNTQAIANYNNTRDYPALAGTTRVGVHLRFGTTSVRHLVRLALETNPTYLNELIWREFYQSILFHFPHISKGLAFKPAYDNIPWRNNEEEFDKWCNGQTGYPIVDAGMRELNATGFMHNRIRMVTASFLTKHLLIDWRWGEAYFAQKLLDYEFASNNGGWQWAAGSGCDAAPYFRIFNPYLQTKRFDKDLHYVKKWVPEFEEFNYPEPIVEHEFARKRAIEVYRKALQEAS